MGGTHLTISSQGIEAVKYRLINTDSPILCMIYFVSGVQLIANACGLKYSCKSEGKPSA